MEYVRIDAKCCRTEWLSVDPYRAARKGRCRLGANVYGYPSVTALSPSSYRWCGLRISFSRSGYGGSREIYLVFVCFLRHAPLTRGFWLLRVACTAARKHAG